MEVTTKETNQTPLINKESPKYLLFEKVKSVLSVLAIVIAVFSVITFHHFVLNKPEANSQPYSLGDNVVVVKGYVVDDNEIDDKRRIMTLTKRSKHDLEKLRFSNPGDIVLVGASTDTTGRSTINIVWDAFHLNEKRIEKIVDLDIINESLVNNTVDQYPAQPSGLGDLQTIEIISTSWSQEE